MIDNEVVGEFGCFKCGQFSMVTKLSKRCLHRYFIKCSKCGYRMAFTQRQFDYAKQHDGYFPPRESLAGEIKGQFWYRRKR
jgi:transcription elongation factor Elf1